MSSTTFSKNIWSFWEKRLYDGESTSKTPKSCCSFMIGITISLRLWLSHAICPWNWWTSSTQIVVLWYAAVPQTPFPIGIRTQATLPWNGPNISSLSSNK